jgi:hypothetical protein
MQEEEEEEEEDEEEEEEDDDDDGGRGDSFHQQIGLKLMEETGKVQHLEHRFVWS